MGCLCRLSLICIRSGCNAKRDGGFKVAKAQFDGTLLLHWDSILAWNTRIQHVIRVVRTKYEHSVYDPTTEIRDGYMAMYDVRPCPSTNDATVSGW